MSSRVHLSPKISSEQATGQTERFLVVAMGHLVWMERNDEVKRNGEMHVKITEGRVRKERGDRRELGWIGVRNWAACEKSGGIWAVPWRVGKEQQNRGWKIVSCSAR